MDDTLRELAALATSLGLGDSPEPARSPSVPSLELSDEPEDATAGVTIASPPATAGVTVASPDATLKPDAAEFSEFSLPTCEELLARPLLSRAAAAAVVSPARAALATTPAPTATGAGLASPAFVAPSCAGVSAGVARGGVNGACAGGRPGGSAVARAMHALQEKVNRLVSAASRVPARRPSRPPLTRSKRVPAPRGTGGGARFARSDARRSQPHDRPIDP